MEEKNEGKLVKTKRKRIDFPLPRANITLSNELNILKAFVEDYKKKEQPLLYYEVTSTTINQYTVSSELKFFASIGLATKQKHSKYIPTSDAIKIADYIMQESFEEGKKMLRKILLRSWFGERVTSVLKIEKEKKINDLIKLLVKDIDGLDFKELPHKDRKTIYRLIEWLEYAEIIEIDENEIVHLKEAPISQNVEEKTPPEEVESISETIIEEEMVKSEGLKKVQKEVLLNLTINIQIDSNTDVEKIREIIRVIKQELVEDTDE